MNKNQELYNLYQASQSENPEDFEIAHALYQQRKQKALRKHKQEALAKEKEKQSAKKTRVSKAKRQKKEKE